MVLISHANITHETGLRQVKHLQIYVCACTLGHDMRDIYVIFLQGVQDPTQKFCCNSDDSLKLSTGMMICVYVSALYRPANIHRSYGFKHYNGIHWHSYIR